MTKKRKTKKIKIKRKRPAKKNKPTYRDAEALEFEVAYVPTIAT